MGSRLPPSGKRSEEDSMSNDGWPTTGTPPMRQGSRERLLDRDSGSSELPPLQRALSRDLELSDRTNRPLRRVGSRDNLGIPESPASDRGKQLGRLDRTHLARSRAPNENLDGRPVSRGTRSARGLSRDSGSDSQDLPRTPDVPIGRFRGTRLQVGEDAGSGEKVAGKREKTGEVHFVGSIVGGSGFPRRTTFASWSLQLEEDWGWTHLAGLRQGSTQPSGPTEDEDALSVWEHPIDLHLKTTTLQLWPKIVLKVFHRSKNIQRDEFYGYSVISLPTMPGIHEFSSSVWRPNDFRSILSDDHDGYWTGLHPQCVDDAPEDLIGRPGWEQSSIVTSGMGKVHLRMFVVFRGMAKVNPVTQRRVSRAFGMGRALNLQPESDDGTPKGRRQVRRGQTPIFALSLPSTCVLQSQRSGRTPRPMKSTSSAGDESPAVGHSRRGSRDSLGGFGALADPEESASPAGGRKLRPRRSSSRAGMLETSFASDADDKDSRVSVASGDEVLTSSPAGRRARHRRSGSRISEGQLDMSRDSLPDTSEPRPRERYRR